MSSDKTKNLIRKNLPTSSLVPNTSNPNEMTDAQFNQLASSIEKFGFVDPIFVRELGDEKYRIIGGHHRYDYAVLEGMEEVPCTIVNDPEFDDDLETFAMVKMNVVRGQLSPDKFLKLYQTLSPKYADEVLIDSFGFAAEEDFRKLIKSISTSLPQEIKKKFDEAAKELKTIDDLSKVLNKLFTAYGSTLPTGFMVFDFGGKESVWLRMSNDTRKALHIVGKLCVSEKKHIDSIVGGMIQMMAEGKLSEQLLQLLAKAPDVEIPEGITMPTEENIAGSGL